MRRISERNYIVAMCQKSIFAFWILADKKTILTVIAAVISVAFRVGAVRVAYVSISVWLL